MAVLDDLIASGLTLAQAEQVVLEDTTSSNTDGLVAAGFSPTLAVAINGYNADKTAANLDVCVQQGMWAGDTLTAVKAALDVTP